MTAVSMAQSHRPLYGLLEDKVAIYAGTWAIGATGAVGTQTGGKGLTLTRTGVGLYTIQLTGSKGLAARVQALLHVHFGVVMNDGNFYQVRAKTAVASTGVITIAAFAEAAGSIAVTELPNGAVLSVCVVAKLSSTHR